MANFPASILQVFQEKLNENIIFNIVKVEGGTFQMGGNEYSWEKPIHEVKLDTFYIGQFPVTQEIWEAIMGENPSYFKGPKRPVENVSWEDAQVFLEKLNQKLDLKGARAYRLPTEAEWEFAARGGIYSQGFSYAGSENLEQVGWYGENSEVQTQPVGILQPNELGIYDMSGNVWEWCQDWWDRDNEYYEQCHKIGIVANPQGPEKGQYRVVRGGGWGYGASSCRVADRGHDTPAVRYGGFGLRLSRTAL
ncbi:MAG: formylglycine-generating enzyme family protein [Bacteroidia bacterium]